MQVHSQLIPVLGRIDAINSGAKNALIAGRRVYECRSLQLVSEKLGLEQRLADRACEVASLPQQLQQTWVQFEHYQVSVAQQRAHERHGAEQRHQRLEHELTELRQHLLVQQARLGKLQALEQHLTQDNDHLQDTCS